MFDLVVIGGGVAGSTAAIKAAALGKRVAVVERTGRFGGTCRYVGCTPSKTLLHVAEVVQTMRVHAGELGLPTAAPAIAWEPIRARLQAVIRAVGGDDGEGAPGAFLDHAGTVVVGEARFMGPHHLRVGSEIIESERFIIATGARPRIPAIPGLTEVGYLTWESIFTLPALPTTLAVLGGGPLGIELAQAFQRLGSVVMVFEEKPDILSQADPAAVAVLRPTLEAEGIQFRCGTTITSVERTGDEIVLTHDGDTTQVSHLLVAGGTRPNTDFLALDQAGVELDDDGAIIVDDELRTTNRHIWAAGDVTGRRQFAHVAAYEAEIAVANALENAHRPNDQRVVPWAVYTGPTLAHVGLSEAEARKQELPIVVATLPLAEAAERALLVAAPPGLLKAVAHRDSGVLLGMTIVAPAADTMIHEAALAVQCKLTVKQIAETIHANPTWSQAVQAVSQQLAEQMGQSTDEHR